MSLIIFHGEHHVKSRQAYTAQLEKLKLPGVTSHSFEVKHLQPSELEQLLGTNSLFSEKTVIQIEELHSLPKSERKTQLIKLLQQTDQEDISVVLWEKKKLTATELKNFSQAKIQAFPLSSKIFAWINSLDITPVEKQLKLLQDAVATDGAEFCFAMFARQIRIWLGKAPPNSPRLTKLLRIHEDLTLLDFSIKTGQSSLTLEQALSQCVLKLNS